MPKSFDTAQYQADFDPLTSKLNWNLGEFPIDLAKIAADAFQQFTDFVLQALTDLTGFDFTTFIPLVHTELTNLEALFGDLSPTSFDPVGAIDAFLNLVIDNVTSLPTLPFDILTGGTGLLAGLGGGLTGLSGGTGNSLLSFLSPSLGSTAGNVFSPILSGLSLTNLTGLLSFLNPTSILSGGGVFGPLLSLIPGLSTLADLGGFLAPASGLTSGVGIFAPILSGGSIFTSLIPGLDASKIVSGTFSASLVQPLIDAVSQGFGGSTGLGFSGLLSFLSGLTFGGSGTVIDAIVQTFLGLTGTGYSTGNLITALESIPAAFLSGTILPGNLSSIGAGSIGTAVSQLLTNANFLTNPFIGGTVNNWTWDNTTGPGTLSTSVYTTGNSALNQLFSNPIFVQPSQVLNLSTYTKWAGFSGPANSIALQLTKYLGGVLQSTSTIASIASPGTSGGWTQLSGSYTVPSDGSIDMVKLVPTVLNTATAGTIHFGQMSATNPATSLFQSIIPSLTSGWGGSIASSLLSGVLGSGLIPGLDASKIISGVFGAGLIPSLTSGWGGTIASSLLSGVLGQGLIPSLTGGWGGTIASSLLSGVLGTSLIPGLDASKIISGTFAQSMVSGLVSSLAGLVPFNIFNANASAATNLVIDPSFEDTTIYRESQNDDGGTANQNLFTYSTDFAHSGTHSLKVVMANASDGHDQCWCWLMPHASPVDNDQINPIQVDRNSGKSFYMSIWVYSKAGNAGGGNLQLGIQYHDSTGGNSGYPSTANTFSIPATGTWTNFNGYLTVPSGYDEVWPYVQFNNSAPVGNTYYVDDAVVQDQTQSQNIISSLFGGTSIGSSLLSSIIPGLDASKIITGVFGSGLIPSLTGGWGGTIASSLLSGVLGTSLIPGLDASKITTGTFANSFLPGLGSYFDNFMTGTTGQSYSGSAYTDVLNATTAQTQTISGNAALIAQMQAGLTTGTADSDAFERTSIGTNWQALTSSGTLSDDGHNIHYSGTGSSAEYVMRKSNIVTANDHMSSTIITNQAAPSYPLFTPFPYGSYLDVWVRCSAFTTFATRSGVRLRVYSAAPYTASWSLDNIVNGTATNLATGSCSQVAANANITLEAGAGGTTRRYLGSLNGTPICDFTDASNVTTVGSSNRTRGFGGKGNSGVGPSLGVADIAQWAGG